MSIKYSDREIMATLLEKIGVICKPGTYNEEDDLVSIDFSILGLIHLSSEIGQLTNLHRLYLFNNQLSHLPPEIGQLTNLHRLYLQNNLLSHLPPEIGQLTNLSGLELYNNQLSHLPPEIGQLTNLSGLELRNNQLSHLPPEIGQLTNLRTLDLRNNQLSHLPPEIGQLINLQQLYLNNNQLNHLPSEIGQLTNLQELDLSGNQITQIPLEVALLTKLKRLALNNNPLLTPPLEIVSQDTKDVIAFLRDLRKKSIIRYEAKLLIVGEAGTGKSSLLRTLRNEVFDPQLSTTHGIEISHLRLPHPNQSQTEIILNTWDFGGQQIYHTTHQFFLTRRSLYLVAWNARLGVEQSRLDYWLHTIKVLAPDAPVILVATHIDERAPDLNYQLYKDAYPQLVGHLSMSNRTGEGLDELRTFLINQASHLPFMGQPWPQTWVDIEKALLDRPEPHIDADTYIKCCTTKGVDADIAKGTLGNYLHDLGKILYFRDDYVLSNLVILKPNWVTKAISRVLNDKVTHRAKGILLHYELPRIWSADYEPYLYPVFLRLMERFDLSYQIETDIPGDQTTRSLIPQLLPHQPPENLPPWPRVPAKGLAQVEMVYRPDFVPAGIMSWFIVRTHRYSQNIHWREGVLLAYERHQARVELNPMLRELRLLVQGPLPQNFFTILKNTIDLILDRFEGLSIRREVPCICHWERGVDEPCGRFYRYEDLVHRMEAGKYKVECPVTFVEVSVPTLLYGIHSSTYKQVMDDIMDGQKKVLKRLDDLQKLDTILVKLNQQSELIGRNFTRQWNLEMKKLEAECPNIFFLEKSHSSHLDPRNLVSQNYWLYLVCQHPLGPHRVGEGYLLQKAREWWITISPWLNHLVKFLKFGIPMGKAIGAVVNAVDIEKMQSYIDLMEEITNNLPEVADLDSMKGVDKQSGQDVVGPALRALHSFLNEVDPSQKWGSLHKILTPDGNILWLCGEHYKEYEVKPLQL